MRRAVPSLITSAAQAEEHIRRYAQQLQRSSALRERAGYARAWYALRGDDGGWTFAPSKFVGYRYASAEEYLKDSGGEGPRDGRQTERVLEQWFEVVEPNTRLGRELSEALRIFLSHFGQAPNARARINVARQSPEAAAVDQASLRPSADDHILNRVTADPRICGGRPCIRGTRMRVTDIVDMLAHGATRAEILQDFDYLSEEDITAALYYAARAADHRVIQTA
jgi:uncharacterized protein (DUF433 family)